MVRDIFYYEHHYLEFYKKQTPEVKKKLIWTLDLISSIERVPEKFFKHITGSDGIYEIRVEVGTNIFRVFSCFDKGKLIILFNGFQKKTQKTPMNEIALAEKLKKQYFNEKDE
jgi:phage-related protein